MKEKEMSAEKFFEYLRKSSIIIGDYKIQYNGEKFDTIMGRTESWIIIRKLPLIEENKNIENLKKHKIISGTYENKNFYSDEYNIKEMGNKINELIYKVNALKEINK